MRGCVCVRVCVVSIGECGCQSIRACMYVCVCVWCGEYVCVYVKVCLWWECTRVSVRESVRCAFVNVLVYVRVCCVCVHGSVCM